MPASLMDMFSGKAPLEFSPRDYAGNQIGMGDAIAQNSNALVGLGMGLLQPQSMAVGAPVSSPWSNALQGYQAGSVADSRRGYQQAQLQHQKTQAARAAAQHGAQQARQAREDAYRREQDTLNRDLQERQFARTDPQNRFSEAQLAMRDVLGPDATPEQKAEFMRDYYRPKTEGNLVAQAEQRRAIAKAQGLDENDPKVRGWIAGGGALNEKPRDLSVTDITKLSEEGGKFAQVGSFTNTFEPRFAGYGSSMLGGAANLAGRNLPEGVVGKDVAEGATWWQGYDRYKNVIRNELYGAALTPSEQAVFEAADITPGMDPKQIQKNLATQKEIVQNGIKRKANAMIAAGYDPATIANAYGVNLKDIGVTATGRGAATPATPATPAPATPVPAAPTAPTSGSRAPVRVNSPGAARKLPSGTPIILPDGRTGTVP